jgi:hypothetical protein
MRMMQGRLRLRLVGAILDSTAAPPVGRSTKMETRNGFRLSTLTPSINVSPTSQHALECVGKTKISKEYQQFLNKRWKSRGPLTKEGAN